MAMATVFVLSVTTTELSKTSVLGVYPSRALAVDDIKTELVNGDRLFQAEFADTWIVVRSGLVVQEFSISSHALDSSQLQDIPQ